GRTVMGARQIATQTSDLCPESAHGHGGRRLARTLSQDGKRQRINHLTSRALWILTGSGPQLQQAYGKRRQQAQQAYQAVNALQLSLLDATPAFEALVIVLDRPPMPIPVYTLPGLLEGGSGNRCQQNPFQRVFSGWSLLFPDADDPDLQRLFACLRF